MSEPRPSSDYWRGFRQGLPFLFVIVPFALLFGVVGTEAGLDIAEVMGFSVLVIAGAAQFAALQLLQTHAPTFIVLATALAVNLRMAMYSASLAPHLGKAPLWQRAILAYLLIDQSYACAMVEYERRPELPVARKVAFFFGVVSPVVLPWYLATWVGATLGAAIPEAFALDFAVPITFLALVTPMMRSLAHIAAAVVSIAVALMLAGLPYNLGLLVAAAAAMVTGARVEIWMVRRQAR